jgi:hypothetical protein
MLRKKHTVRISVSTLDLRVHCLSQYLFYISCLTRSACACLQKPYFCFEKKSIKNRGKSCSVSSVYCMCLTLYCICPSPKPPKSLAPHPPTKVFIHSKTALSGLYILQHLYLAELSFSWLAEKSFVELSRVGQIATKRILSGPQMALAYRLDAISQGPKHSRIPGPNPLPLALVMDMHAASKT